MEVYYFTIIILGLFAFYEISTKGAKGNNGIIQGLKFFAYVILVCQTGLRWETGTDWLPYYDHFQNFNNNNKWFGYKDQMEVGYEVWVHYIFDVFRNYTVFLMSHAMVYYLLIFIAFERILPYFFLGLLLFYASTMGLLGSHRQLIALAICLNALVFLLKGNRITFFVLVGVAFLFHTSALLFALYYFVQRHFKLPYIIIGLIICIGIGYTSLPVKIFALTGGINDAAAGKATIYIDKALEDDTKLSLIGLFKRLAFVALFLYNRKRIIKIFPNYIVLLNGYLLGIGFYFLFANSLLVMLSRGSLYFNAMEPVLLSVQLLIIRQRSIRDFVISGLIALSFINLKQSIALYPELFDPYKSIFYNKDFHRLTL